MSPRASYIGQVVYPDGYTRLNLAATYSLTMKWVDGFFISNSAHVCQVVQREMKENKIKERSCKQWANIKNRTTFCNYWGRKAATWDLRICWKIFFYTGNIIYIEQRNLRCITIFTDNSHLEDLKIYSKQLLSYISRCAPSVACFLVLLLIVLEEGCFVSIFKFLLRQFSLLSNVFISDNLWLYEQIFL